MNLPIFALRNLGRTPVKTGIKALALGLVTAIMIVWATLNAGLNDLLESAATSMESGEFQLHSPNYQTKASLYTTVDAPELLESQLTERGYATSLRLYGNALAATKESSSGIDIRAFDVEKEKKVTNIHTLVGLGQWLDPNSSSGVVLGKTLAKRLKVSLNDEIILVGQAADGSLANGVFFVRGILEPLSQSLDQRALYMTEKGFRDYFLLAQGVHEIAIKRPTLKMSYQIAKEDLKELTKGRAALQSWRQIKPVIAKTTDILDVSAIFVLIFIYLTLGSIILNTMLMTVYERIREFGTMAALGMTPVQMIRLVLFEALWLAIFSSITALTLGIPLAWWFSQHGFDLSLLMDQYALAGVTLKPIIFGRFSWSVMLKPPAFLVAALVVFSVYPGFDMARKKPVETLYDH